jgi:hypothetical protein
MPIRRPWLVELARLGLPRKPPGNHRFPRNYEHLTAHCARPPRTGRSAMLGSDSRLLARDSFTRCVSSDWEISSRFSGIAAIHLRCTSGDNNRRRLHLSERIAGHSAGVPDTRVQVGRRISTHAHRDVSPPVHSHARHPQIIGLALERARLVEGEISPVDRNSYQRVATLVISTCFSTTKPVPSRCRTHSESAFRQLLSGLPTSTATAVPISSPSRPPGSK